MIDTEAVLPVTTGGGGGASGSGFVRRLVRQPTTIVSLTFLVIVIAACVLAPVLANYPESNQELTSALAAPSHAHYLGVNQNGQDIYTELLYGGQISLLGVLQGLIVLGAIGITLGLIAGYFGGIVDLVISRTVDLLMAIPPIIVILAVLAIFTGMLSAMVTFGILLSAGLIRVVRGVTLTTRNETYIEAARVSGLGRLSIIARHVLPRLVGPIIVQMSLFAGILLGVQTGIAFLGLGVVPPAPSWGGMVSDASQAILLAPWMIIPSGAVIALTIIAFVLLGDAARDAMAEPWSDDAPARAGRTRSGTVTPVAAAAVAEADSDTSQEAADAVLSVRGLTVAFDDRGSQRLVVNNASFDLRAGEIVGLVGESGSGKTVSCLSMLQLLPGTGRVVSGEALFAGKDLLTLPEDPMRAIRGRAIGYISQEPLSSLDPSFTIKTQLREVMRCHRAAKTPVTMDEMIEALTRAGLRDPEKVLRSYPHELSGGMAQRVCIALALAGNPDILIADEPTTALDVTVQAAILDLLRSLRASRRLSVIFVTHNLAVVADLCDRAIVMQHGRIVEQSQVTEMFRQPTHEYTRALLDATPNLLGAPGRSPADVDVTSPGRPA
jgi:peptide/nickel transport system permease protein